MTMYDFIDQRKVLLITFAVIFAISALIAPSALFYPAKAMFITPLATHIGTTFVSLITGGIGLLLIAGGLIAIALMERSVKKYSAVALLFAVGLLGTALSLTDYYYMTDQEFVYNGPWEFTHHSYTWDDFEKIEEHVVVEGNSRTVQSVALYMKDGNEIEMSSGAIFNMAGPLSNYIQYAGGQYERIEVDGEG